MRARVRRLLAVAACVCGMPVAPAVAFAGLPTPTALQVGPAPPASPMPDSLDGERYGRLSAADITVRFAPRDSLVAVRVLDFLRTLAPLPGLPPDVPRGVTVVLAHSAAALDQSIGGTVPEWRGGVAVPSRRLLVVPTREGTRPLDPEGRRVLLHEWAHLGLHGHLGDLRVPRWFDEGYAQWASAGFDATEAWRLRVMVAAGNTPPLDSLTLAWPRGRTEADAAYLLTASALTHLLGDSGSRGLALFLGRWKEGRSFEAAFRETFGLTTSQFEEDWKRHVRDRYGWLFVLSHSAVFWLLLTLGLLVMVQFRKRYNRDRMARLRAGEEPERPAYWDGEEPEPRIRVVVLPARVPGPTPSEPPDSAPEPDGDDTIPPAGG